MKLSDKGKGAETKHFIQDNDYGDFIPTFFTHL